MNTVAELPFNKLLTLQAAANDGRWTPFFGQGSAKLSYGGGDLG